MALLGNYLTVGVICILVLFLLGYMAWKNEILSPEKRKYLLLTIVATALVVFAEMATSVLDPIHPKFYVWNLVANSLGFAISPSIPILLSLVIRRSYSRHTFGYFLPTIINGAMVILSPFCGLIFSITVDQGYLRGAFFSVYIIAYLSGLIILLVVILQVAKHSLHTGKFILPLMFVFVIIGTSVQVLNPQVHTTWLCITFSIVLYYAFICEFNDKHDVLTSLFNRRAFENAKIYHQSTGFGTAVVFDVDDFKGVNDTYGHAYGDYCLSTIGLILTETFQKVGCGYRVGGDEFCVLCETTDVRTIQKCINALELQIQTQQKNETNFPAITYGFCTFGPELRDVNQALEEADVQMYQNKRKKAQLREQK